jgi:hypothetical protein
VALLPDSVLLPCGTGHFAALSIFAPQNAKTGGYLLLKLQPESERIYSKRSWQLALEPNLTKELQWRT